MSLLDEAKRLSIAIKEADEFRAMKQAKNVIDGNRELSYIMENYNREQMEFMRSGKSGNNMEAKAAELKQKFQDLAKIPEVQYYLKAANSFNDLMVQVYKYINDLIEEDL
ncbi:YlbF family regulator [Clostridium formicaceticum]|uniref:YlbF family regulator n=1 Tax=Clostridium formicaceticum TaxID=1497 RepID=A0AAC9RMD6_9CLOT|nr:YlbF family regulator [Clostridium formicaceticum]AOY78066.1 hypothetical protein BJL90_20685 [Clostridium formicaceticum]ARE88706.1 hypothetical protein CLFO_31120 [Clostridium formicaceticum]